MHVKRVNSISRPFYIIIIARIIGLKVSNVKAGVLICVSRPPLYGMYINIFSNSQQILLSIVTFVSCHVIPAKLNFIYPLYVR